MKFCTNCGAKLPDEAKFCHACGSKVADVAEPLEEKEVKTPETEDGAKKQAVEAPAAEESKQEVTSPAVQEKPAKAKRNQRPSNPVKERTPLVIALVIASIIYWIFTALFTQIFWLGKIIIIGFCIINAVLNIIQFVKSIVKKDTFQIFLFASYSAICLALTIINLAIL